MKLGRAFLAFLVVSLLVPLITRPVSYAQDPPSDTVWIVPLVDSLTVESVALGTSFRMSVEVTNSDELYKMVMNFALKDTDLVRLDSFSYSDPTCRLYDPETLEARVETLVAPDVIEMSFEEPALAEGDYLSADSGKIIDLWFSSIKDGVFSFEKDSLEFITTAPYSFEPGFVSYAVTFPSRTDPGNPDSLWIKKGLEAVRDTIGINANFPLPFTACNDQILSGFEIPLLIDGNNVPTFHQLTFEDSDLRDTILVPDDSTLEEDSTVLIRLELKKELSDTLLEPGADSRLFNLWLQADDEAGSCTIFPAFVPHLSNLFFIDDTGGFTPYSSGVACSTFYYKQGDITRNEVLNNVDLFYLAVHLFLPPDDTSTGKLRYDPEDLERIESQKAFQRSKIPSEEWDSTFSQILFRGDVNGDSRVDVGDFYVMSRHFQAGTSGDLEYGWSDPRAMGPCNNDTVRLNFRKAYPGQKIQILVEIYNENSLAAVTIPLRIPDITRIQCDSVTLAGRFADLEYFDWEWITWDEDYDGDTTNQDILIALSTLGIEGFPHILPSGSTYADSAFVLWCTVESTLDTSDYLESVSLLPSHSLSFFETESGLGCQPELQKSIVDTVLADYGDAPDETNPCYAGCSFPTLCNTSCCRICGRQGPYHQYDPVCTEWLGTLTNPPDTEWVPMVPDMDQDDLTGTLYLQAAPTAWYIAPVTVTSDTDLYRYLNVLYDVDRDREWKEKEYTEWVIQNKLIIPSCVGTEDVIIGPFNLDQLPSLYDTAWARFTLTRDSIPTALFDSVGGWDGSGPSGGWHYGETEDIPFDKWKGLTNEICFSVNSDSLCEVPSQGAKVNVVAKVVGVPPGDQIKGLTLNWQVFDSTGAGSTLTCTFDTSDPGGWHPDSFDLGRPPVGDSVVTFTYDVSFPGDPNERTCRVQWKVGKTLGDGTKLVATAETEFSESATPYFVFLNSSEEPISWDDTTISYYGGVVDLRLYVVDPDSDYDIRVTFDRSAFQHAVYDPIFGESKYAGEMTVSGPGDPLIFHWAADDTTDVDVGTRIAIFTAEEMVGEQASVCETLTIHVSDADTLLPDSNKVWVGRTGVIAAEGLHFEVPVEVYNTTNVIKIELPFKIQGYTDVIDTSSYSCLYDDSRLSDPDTLNQREFYISFPDTVKVKFEKDVGYSPLSSGFGRIFNLCFQEGRTSFQIDTLWKITFWESDEIQFDPAFESHEITVIEEEPMWICGDADGDGEVGLTDVVFLIPCIFRYGPCPVPPERGDVNCLDGKYPTLTDVVYLINYLFKGGPPPQRCDYNCIPPKTNTKRSSR